MRIKRLAFFCLILLGINLAFKRSGFTVTLVDYNFSLISGLIIAMKVAYGMVGLLFLDSSSTDIPRRLPMARVWPPSRFGFSSYPLSQQSIDLPPQDTQDSLLELYFTNIHPTFPVLHKTRFLTEYNARFLKSVHRVLPVTD
jgi:hypothetical protein